MLLFNIPALVMLPLLTVGEVKTDLSYVTVILNPIIPVLFVILTGIKNAFPFSAVISSANTSAVFAANATL